MNERTADWSTPFERGNGNQTTTWADCIAFHQRLAAAFPQWLRFEEAGRSDAGVPIHVGVFTCDGEFDPAAVKSAGRPVFFNNNGIHPGEPEGIDACMALLRDLCVDEARRAALGRTVLVYIPVYNVDGALNRDLQQNWRVGGTRAFPLDRANSIKLYVSSGVSARTGNNFDLAGVAWQYRWGGGL